MEKPHFEQTLLSTLFSLEHFEHLTKIVYPQFWQTADSHNEWQLGHSSKKTL